MKEIDVELSFTKKTDTEVWTFRQFKLNVVYH